MLSAAEFLLGALIVIGYNVFHVVPNEVLVLLGLGLLSIWIRVLRVGLMTGPVPLVGRRGRLTATRVYLN